MWNDVHATSHYLTRLNVELVNLIEHVISLRKKFFRSQAQRAGNRQILEARKKLHELEIFCQSMGGLEILIWLFCQRRLLQWHPFVSLIKRICLSSLFTFKEREFWFVLPKFLKFTFYNFTSPVGLEILKFYLPGPNFTSPGHRACTIFRRLCNVMQQVYLSGHWWSHYTMGAFSLPTLFTSFLIFKSQNLQCTRWVVRLRHSLSFLIHFRYENLGHFILDSECCLALHFASVVLSKQNH